MSISLIHRCVLRGCVPKKLLVYSSKYSHDFEDSRGYGWNYESEPTHDWSTLMANKNAELQRLTGIYKNILKNAGVKSIEGRGKILDPHTVDVDGKLYTTRHILISVGGRPFIPDIPGSQYAIDSDAALDLPSRPKKIAIIGGGYIAVEFAGIFNGLKSEVHLFIRQKNVLRGFDEEVRDFVSEQIALRGIEFHTEESPQAILKTPDGSLSLKTNKGNFNGFSHIMFATGRRPNTKNLGLESVGVQMAKNGAIVVDEYSRTSVPSIWAVGDVTDRVNLTPVALMEGGAFAKTVFGNEPTKPDYRSGLYLLTILKENNSFLRASWDWKHFEGSNGLCMGARMVAIPFATSLFAETVAFLMGLDMALDWRLPNYCEAELSNVGGHCEFQSPAPFGTSEFRSMKLGLFCHSFIVYTLKITLEKEMELLTRLLMWGLWKRQVEVSSGGIMAVPSAVFSQPPIGQLGLTEEQAIEKYGDIDVFTSNFRPLKATLSGLPDRVFMKLIVCAKTNKVLGLHMCGDDSPEIVQGFAVAVKAGLTKADFDWTVGIHPTAAEEFVTMRTPTRKLRKASPPEGLTGQPVTVKLNCSCSVFTLYTLLTVYIAFPHIRNIYRLHFIIKFSLFIESVPPNLFRRRETDADVKAAAGV
ncbi:hypothetical protein GIB67_018146 [Kingdonia uniflora]|uniref:glutathione-disulfide reductase n=1 Tax=Kingdonia uniflora TaxID=39325 RepID=A0A7J7NME3_9MAGN|nr:hypothetical protein GIB67_018146 [Kingdonia uniflora]